MQSPKITVICGPMYSGKSEELIRLVRRSRVAGKRTLVIKPEIDNRYSEREVASHNGTRIQAQRWSMADINVDDALASSNIYDVVAFDEAQFFPAATLVALVLALQERGKDVIVAGLDMDYKRDLFGCIHQLLGYATTVYKLAAICHNCGNDAPYTYRLPSKDDGEVVQVGGLDEYEARCWGCYES